jgi:hypothetical protein
MVKKIEQHHLELVCPECFKNTKVKTQDGVNCSHCEKSFMGLTFQKVKIVSTSFVLFAITAAVGGTYIGLEEKRLPYNTEYKLMTSCINMKGSTVNSDVWKERINTCSCAIEKAVLETDRVFDEDINEIDKKEITNKFYENVKSSMRDCK